MIQGLTSTNCSGGRYSSTNVSFMSTRKCLMVPFSSISTLCSEIQAPRIPSTLCWAFAMPLRMASSKDPGEVDVTCKLRILDGIGAPLLAESSDVQNTPGGVDVWEQAVR